MSHIKHKHSMMSHIKQVSQEFWGRKIISSETDDQSNNGNVLSYPGSYGTNANWLPSLPLEGAYYATVPKPLISIPIWKRHPSQIGGTVVC